ncbi:MAG: hypothetical protein WAU70_03495 [Flavobacteriales bacterium]
MEKQLKDLVEVLHYRIADGDRVSGATRLVDGLPVKVRTETSTGALRGLECNMEVRIGNSKARVQLIVTL